MNFWPHTREIWSWLSNPDVTWHVWVWHDMTNQSHREQGGRGGEVTGTQSMLKIVPLVVCLQPSFRSQGSWREFLDSHQTGRWRCFYLCNIKAALQTRWVTSWFYQEADVHICSVLRAQKEDDDASHRREKVDLKVWTVQKFEFL